MKKLKSMAIGIGITALIAVIGYFIFLNPSGFTSKEELVKSYFISYENETVCNEHFQPETTDFCSTFTTLLEGKTVELKTISQNNEVNSLDIVVTIDEIDVNFTVTFYEKEVTGTKGIVYSKYYYIDFIE